MALIGLLTGDILSSNVFTYCLNNPVNRIDRTGYASKTVTVTTKGLNWSIKTTVKFTYQGGKKGKITNVIVTQKRSFGFLWTVSVEGTTSKYPRNPKANIHIVVAYFMVSTGLKFVYTVWRHTINLKGDGTWWTWTMADLYGRIPYTYS
jgi:hypothetical protein